jgi:Gly-Xaa carboxypeptidase
MFLDMGLDYNEQEERRCHSKNSTQKSLSVSKRAILTTIVSTLLLWHVLIPSFDLDFLNLIQIGSEQNDFKKQCQQVEPLRPKQTSKEFDEMEALLASDVFRNASIQRLAGAVQIPTMSYDDLGAIGEDDRWDVFYDLARYLEETYPKVYSTFTVDKVNTHGLAFTWLGNDITRKPLLLMAHQDVVPVPKDTIPAWTHPPFSGFYDGKLIWGRGSSDCKNSLTGILDALEQLIIAGFAPTRSIVLAFGFDEEISGRRGAGHLSQFLLQKYGKDSFAAIVDEGAGSYKSWATTFMAPGVAEKVRQSLNNATSISR